MEPPILPYVQAIREQLNPSTGHLQVAWDLVLDTAQLDLWKRAFGADTHVYSLALRELKDAPGMTLLVAVFHVGHARPASPKLAALADPHARARMGAEILRPKTAYDSILDD